MADTPKFDKPMHPGKMLQTAFLIPLNLTPEELSEAIHLPVHTVNNIISGTQDISPITALRLATYFQMSEFFWMNLQLRLDMYHAQKDNEAALQNIRPRRSKSIK